MAITYVGGQVGGRAGSTSTSNVTFALTGGTNSTPQAGDLVIIGCTVASQARTPACAISGYTAETQINANGTTYDTSLNMSRKFMGGTPDTTFTLPSTGNIADAQRWTVQVWRGVDATTPFDATPVSASGTATGRPNPGSITPTTTGAFVGIIGAGAAATGAAYTAPANYTTNFLTGTTADTNDAMIGSGYRSWTSGAEDPAAYTGGTTNAVDSWAAFTYALRPSGGAYTLTAQGGSYSLTGSSVTITRGYSVGTVLQTGYNVDDSGSSSTTIATSLSGVQAGSTIVAFVGWSDFTIGTNCTVSDGTSYTAAGDGKLLQVTDNQNSQVFYLPNASSGSHTVTATFSATTGYRRIRLFEVAGVATSSVEDGAAHQQQNTVGTTTNSISSSATATTSNANNFVLGLTQDTSSVDPGSGTMAAGTGYTLIGTNQILAGEYKNVSSTGTQTATFTDSKNSHRTTHVLVLKNLSTGATNHQLTAQGGSYTLAGASAVLQRSKYLSASGGNYSYTGASAVLTWAPLTNNYVLTALGGSYAYTGASVGISRNRKLTSNGGAYTVTGGTATLLRSKRLVTTGGAYVVTGASANVNRNRKLTATAGSYSLSGSNATINRNRTLTAQGGVYTYTGQQVVITYTAGTTNYTLTALGGAYTLTGGTALLARNRVLVSSGGSYSYSGSSASIARNRVLTSSGGSYSYTGSSASLLRSKYLSATGGVYSVTGATANIFKSKRLVASGGSYVYTGNTITLKRSKYLNVSGGSYSLVGSSANITWGSVGGAVWPPVHLVLLGTVYGPTGTEYTGTLDVNGIKYDITTGQLVKPINDKVVMSI